MSRSKLELPAGLIRGMILGLLTGFAAARMVLMARRQVSPRGGNELSFVLMKALLRSMFAGLLAPITVHGADNVPRTGGVLLTPNHLSDVDVGALYVGLPRWAWYVAKEEIFSIPILGKMIPWYHAFPIKRKGPPDHAAMKKIMDLLSEGEAVVLFPEGRESEDGALLEFQPGAAMLALRAKATIVPAVLNGTQRVLPYGQVILRPAFKRTHVWFGPPINLDNLPTDRHERLQEVTRRTRQGVLKLMECAAPEWATRSQP